MATEILSAEKLRELFSYDPATGAFTRLVRSAHCVKVGDIAGCKTSTGYSQISISCRSYFAHRLAWLHVHGRWPECFIDHIDGNRYNNAIANLREASRSVNQQNLKEAMTRNASGLLGVSRHGKKWAAKITIDGKCRYLGCYKTAELAHAAYLDAKRLLHVGCTI